MHEGEPSTEPPMACPSPQDPSTMDMVDKYYHKEMFYKEFENFIQNTYVKRQAKCVVRQELYDKSLACLKSPKGQKFEDYRLKSWAKSKFMIVTVDGKEKIYCNRTHLPVITFEKMFDTIDEAHSRIGHHGRDKTRDEILQKYAFIPYKAVEIYVKNCHRCGVKGPRRRSQPEKPIMVTSYMAHVQAELIDLSSCSDSKYSFILHLKDHFTKYCWLFPLRHKEARHAAKKVLLVFSMFGSPRVLQCETGFKDFFAEIVKFLKVTFPGLVLKTGRVRCPQVQGRPGRSSHDDVAKILDKTMKEKHTQEWSKLLPDVMNYINNYTPTVGIKTPYEILFGQAPQHFTYFYSSLAELDAVDPVSAPLPPTTSANQPSMEPQGIVPVSPAQAPHVPIGVIPTTRTPDFHPLHFGEATTTCYNN